MMDGIARHYDKVILTLIMCLAILFMATFSPFAEKANAIAIVDDAIIAIIIAGLAACGITFITSGAYATLDDYVNSQFTEYATSIGATPEALISGAQTGSNKLGQLLLNNKFVLIIDAFGNWLKTKYSLTNNSSKTLVASGQLSSASGVMFYKLPWSSARNPSNYIPVSINGVGGGKLWLYGNHQNADDYYVAFSADGHILVISPSQYYGGQYIRILSGSGSLIAEGAYPTNTASYNGIPTIPWYYYNGPNALMVTGVSVGSYVSANTWNDLRSALASGLSVSTESIIINTGNVVLPNDDTAFDEGDGALLDVGASWGESYSDITENTIPEAFSESNVGTATITYDDTQVIEEQVEDTGEITNLPGGAIPIDPSGLPALRLTNIWHYVAQWIADTSIAAGAMMAIVTQFPSPTVNLFYALVALALIFGVIKGLAK